MPHLGSAGRALDDGDAVAGEHLDVEAERLRLF
jgi:hypothetical protein